MKYKISNVTPKTSAKGTPYTQVTLTDEQGTTFDRINLFRGEATGTTEVEGALVKNGDFWNFEATKTFTANMPQRGGGFIAKAQETKAENIELAQDRKFQSIARSGAIGHGTDLVIAMMDSGILEPKSEEEVRNKIYEYSALYEDMYFADKLPSKVEQPF